MIKEFRIPKTFTGDKYRDSFFKINVKVNVKGIFYGHLPDKIKQMFWDHDMLIELQYNSTLGEFSAYTLEEFCKKVEAAIEELCSEEKVGTEDVIEYQINTACAYSIGKDGDFIPTASDRERGGSDWRGGSVDRKLTIGGHGLYGFQIYARPFRKTTYQSKSGKTRIVEESLKKHTHNADDYRGDPVQWLCNLTAIKAGDGSMKVIDGVIHSHNKANLYEVPCTYENAMKRRSDGRR